MRNWLKLIISSAAAISLLAVTSSSHGVAAFARQTGLECNSCHAAPGFPALNSFGAAFKAAGYIQGGGPLGNISGENLELPAALNLGVVFKARIKVKSDATSSSVDMEIPDETAVFAAGQVGNNIGFVIELGDAWFNSFKLVFAVDAGPVKVGVVPWFTDAFGAGWVFETLSTGAVRNIRIIEDRGLISAQSATNWGGAGEASGVGIYIWHPMGFAVFTPFTPMHAAHVQGVGYYTRVAVTPSLDFADLGIGFAYKFGTEHPTHGVYGAHVVDTYNWLAVDAQMMMSDLPLTVVITYALDSAMQTYVADSGGTGDFTHSYLTIGIDYLILEGENPLGVTIAYRHDLSGAQGISYFSSESQIGGAVKFGLTQNVRLSLDVHYGLTSQGLQILPMVSGSW